VRLLNDNSSKIGATILNTDRSLGVVEGGYGLSVKMNFIPRNEIVKVGDIIVTSGLEAGMPRGLLIGSVTAIENETYRPFQAALLLPGTDLSKLSIVSILIAK
jgi:rod shape-determining protein MreC